MSNLGALLPVAGWVLIQVAILRYQIHAIRLCERALRRLDGDGVEEAGIALVGRRSLSAQRWRLTAIVAYLAFGLVPLLPASNTVARVGITVILLYGEIVLLRNTRDSIALVNTLAAMPTPVGSLEVALRELRVPEAPSVTTDTPIGLALEHERIERVRDNQAIERVIALIRRNAATPAPGMP